MTLRLSYVVGSHVCFYYTMFLLSKLLTDLFMWCFSQDDLMIKVMIFASFFSHDNFF